MAAETENKTEEPQATEEAPAQPTVGFPEPAKSRKKSKLPKTLVAIVGVLLIVGGGGYGLFRITSSSSGGDSVTLGSTSEPSSRPASSPTPTPEPIDKEEVKIEVLNGTGTAGDAGFTQGKLEDAGFSDIEVGNADDQDETRATITFSSSLPDNIVSEITEAMEGAFEDVRTKKGSLSGDFDVRIITGLKTGASAATPKPTTATTATPEATEEASPSGSN